MSFFNHLPRLGYSRDLHQQLKGLAADCSGYHGDAVYQFTFIVLLIVSLVLMLNYYYGLFNDPRFTHRRFWLMQILVACGLNGLFAYFRSAAFLPEDKHCDQIHFSALDCGLFSFSVMMYTFITCVLISLLIKWKSITNKKIPF